jgi:two-component system response regulator DevR
LAEGKTNKEIGAALSLSEKTIKNYLANMFAKLQITRRTQAVVLYMEARRRGTPPGVFLSA